MPDLRSSFMRWALIPCVMLPAGTAQAGVSAKRMALEFDGNSGHVIARLPKPLDGDFTLEIWMSSTAVPSLQERAAALAGDQGMLQICVAGGRFVIDNSGGPTKGISSGGGFNDGNWHHVLIKRYEKTTYAFYVDGASVGQDVGTTPAYHTLHIGVVPGQPRYVGLIDEVRLYDRCLTEKEGLSNYVDAEPTPKGLIGWWKLDGDARDGVGQAHGTPAGQLKWAKGRGEAQFDKPRIEARFFAAPGKIGVEVDSRQMGELPNGARWEISLDKPDGSPAADPLAMPVPPAMQGQVSLPADRLSPGQYAVRARIVGPDGKPFALPAVERVDVAERPAWTGKVKVLNNLVMELLNSPVGEVGRTFTNPRDGWVFFAVAGKQDLAPMVRLDGPQKQEISLEKVKDAQFEAMRYLPAGEYRPATASKVTGNLVVRAIPELIFGEFLDQPRVREYGPYDLEYMKRIGILHNINVIEGDANFDNPGHPFCHEWHKLGKRWVGERTIGEAADPREMVEFWGYTLLKTQPFIDGLLIDEFMRWTPQRTEAARLFLADKRFAGKLFYPYVCSPLPDRGGEEGARFMRMVMDAGHRVAWERYLHEERDEKAAWSSIDAAIRREFKQYWEPLRPGVAGSVIMVLGNFLSCLPSESMNHDPAVDFRVWMDMQYNMLANDPMFFGLYGLMEYCSTYAEEEVIRWNSALYRHYGIEGRTEMLSSRPEYGFTYKLAHIANPDFEAGLKGWQAGPAAADSVAPRKYDGYCDLQGRYPGTGQGDTFLWMKRSDKAPNVISQQVVGLTPGKLYSIKLLTADYGDLLARRSDRKTHAVAIEIDGAEWLADRCFQGSWWSATPPEKSGFTTQKPFWVNLHRKVFRAKAPTGRLTISDWASPQNAGGPAGQELMYNFVEVQAYLEP